MIDIRIIRESPEIIKESLKKRFKEDKIKWIDEIIEKDKLSRKLKKEADDLRQKRNNLTSEINELKKKGKDIKKVLLEAKEIPEKIKERELSYENLQNEINYYLLRIPNILHKSVPKGKDASENKEIKKIGKITKKKEDIKNHSDLIEELGLADFETGRVVSGQGFNYLLGDLALLDLALQRYGIDFLVKKGFLVIVPPILIRKDAMEGVINLSDFEEVIYKVDKEDLYLIGTAENSLVPLFKDKKIDYDKLPIKICAVTPCFRKEIGGHGVDTKGLFRMHQFNKVEQVIFSKPEESYRLLEKMQKITESFFESLEIPFRVIEICSGDLGDKQAKQYDIEAWFPRQDSYKEITSASNCTDYQARRLNIKYLKKDTSRDYVHILNNTMVATSRAMVAILENHQNKDNSVNIPKVLQPYMFGKKKISIK
ncbi:MAG: serine--tRNA ligase [Candidatus Nanoarchaeia archaeon]|nr:serine--tRNA ligase [Candidatus Nanoarchaeia archaeon]